MHDSDGFNGEVDGPVRQTACIIVLSVIGLFVLSFILGG